MRTGSRPIVLRDTDSAADRRAEADRLDEARERFITRSDRRSGKPPESGAD